MMISREQLFALKEYLVDPNNGLGKVKRQLAYGLMKNADKIDQEQKLYDKLCEAFEADRLKLAEKYCNRTPDEKPILDSENRYEFTEENRALFNKDFTELANEHHPEILKRTEVEYEPYLIQMDWLPEELELKHVLILKPILLETPSNVVTLRPPG